MAGSSAEEAASHSQHDESTQDSQVGRRKGRSASSRSHPIGNGPSTSAAAAANSSLESPSRNTRANGSRTSSHIATENDHSYHLPVRNGRIIESDTDSPVTRPTRQSAKRALMDWGRGSDIEEEEEEEEESEEAEEVSCWPLLVGNEVKIMLISLSNLRSCPHPQRTMCPLPVEPLWLRPLLVLPVNCVRTATPSSVQPRVTTMTTTVTTSRWPTISKVSLNALSKTRIVANSSSPQKITNHLQKQAQRQQQQHLIRSACGVV